MLEWKEPRNPPTTKDDHLPFSHMNLMEHQDDIPCFFDYMFLPTAFCEDFHNMRPLQVSFERMI